MDTIKKTIELTDWRKYGEEIAKDIRKEITAGELKTRDDVENAIHDEIDRIFTYYNLFDYAFLLDTLGDFFDPVDFYQDGSETIDDLVLRAGAMTFKNYLLDLLKDEINRLD